EGVDLMVELIRARSADVDKEVTQTRGAHTQFTYLRDLFEKHLQCVVRYKEQGNEEDAENYQDCAVKLYLLILVGNTIFTNMSKAHVNLTYL
ncbi:serine/threonine-protein phosphatase 7 long form-like protein, partial [Trifolium medium]|nr:serine/threonine-protein phosphatase 7 long form-like protein [Trifolium medium]